jgi:hypothetical protein
MKNQYDSETIKAKIENGEVKVKGKRSKPKTEKPQKAAKAAPEAQKAPVQREKLIFTDEQMINAVKAIGHAATSREISDKLKIADPDQGRQFVRSRMAALIKDGKIKTSEPSANSHVKFLYEAV